MYAERHIMKAIRDAEAAYGWDIDYRLVDQQEVGGAGTRYEYALEVEGQYAEDDAQKFFSDYGFEGVYVDYTDYSFAEIRVSVTGM